MQREDFDYPFPDLPRLTHFGYSDGEASLRYGPHYHFGYELLYVTQGTASVKVFQRDAALLLEQDDLLVMAPRVEHEFIYDHELITFFWLGFQTAEEVAVSDTHLRTPRRIGQREDVQILHGIDEEIRQVTSSLESASHLHFKHAPQFGTPFRQILNEIHRSDRFSSRMIYQKVLEIFTYIARLEHGGDESENEAAEFARAYMESHSWQQVDFAALAAQAGYSQAHLARLFKANYQVTPKQYHTRLRVRNAKVELRSGRAIREVSHACGFSNSSYFSSWFKANAGMSPAAYAAGSGASEPTDPEAR